MSDYCNCNMFEKCKWLRHLGKIMVLFVMGFVGLSTWAVLVDTLGPVIQSGSRSASIGCLLLSCIFLSQVLMLTWSYFASVCTDPGGVPPGWTPFADEEEASLELEKTASQRSGVESLTGSSRPRYCKKCLAWKPPRAHHDSMTGRCVLKMDHYCVWIANCVGLLNYKAFLLFLFYAFWATGLGSAVLLGAFISFFRQGNDDQTPSITVFVAFVVDVAFFLCLAGFMVVHARLAAVNCTTIEMYEKRRVPLWPYDRGWRYNLREVFGARAFGWFLPFMTESEATELLDRTLNRQQDVGEQTHLRTAEVEI